MSRVANKAARLNEIELLLTDHPEGMTQSELARRLGVNPSTILRNLNDLEAPWYEEGKRIFLDRKAYLLNLRFSLHEALAMHLAARLLAVSLDRQNAHAAAALRKIAQALERLAPQLSRHVSASANGIDELARYEDPVYMHVLETLTSAWAEGRLAQVWHRKSLADPVASYTFAPYYIEPGAWGRSTYVIGLRTPPGEMRTLKIERIEQAELLRERYAIPADFDPFRLLEDAWGIWYTEGEPLDVALRFSPRAAGRVRETRWHRSQALEPQADGSLIWRARVAAVQEMLPWIRGWGADVEVLEPEELKDTLRHEVQRLARLYQIDEMKARPIAHLRMKDQEPQYLWEHLMKVSILTKNFSEKVGLADIGEILGLYHDLGKASQEFQNYLGSAIGFINPDSDDYVDVKAKKGKVDHSSAGAQVIYRNLNQKGSEGQLAAQVISLCIASHHSGLIDCLSPNGIDNFKKRMDKLEENTHSDEALSNLETSEVQQLNDILSKNVGKQLLDKLATLKESNDLKETLTFKYGLLIRFLFSCVIDADRLDTADFEFPQNEQVRNYGQYYAWETLIERFNNKIKEFENKTEKNYVDELRNQVSQSCFDFSTKSKGIYRLTVPTGGGKTLSSLRFALHHAKHHKMDRIIYVIPYTSIIDQNADEVRKILEDRDDKGQIMDRVVLEHHSNLTPEEETQRQNLLAENWDAPIIFTTQVQFLETMFGSGTRSARRMHQLANAVIIFDEVQTIPIRCVQMFNLALRFLVNGCGSTVVLCTATQPLLDKVEPAQRALVIQPDHQIILDEGELFKKLRRVEVFDRRKIGGWSDDEVTHLVEDELQEKGSVLVVVNTKKGARSLYQTIAERKIAKVYHLSTNMCPAHRLDVLNAVKKMLKNRQPIICVSTQLIEAGVDIDFGSVIRFMAGLDSIAQAAGRCNRNGEQKLGNVWVINPIEEHIEKLKDIVIGREVTERVLDEFNDTPDAFGNDRIGLIAMDEYYKYYFYQRKDEMKYRVGADSVVGREDDLFNLLSTNSISVAEHERVTQTAPASPFKQSFQTAAKVFYAIDSPTRGVVVPYGEDGAQIVSELCGAFDIEKQYKLMKKAQRYSVNLFPFEFAQMADRKAIQEVQKGSGIFYLDKQFYDGQFGWCDQTVNPMDFLII
jgi:CRISPR-associated endonuclease/helicase Cas3